MAPKQPRMTRKPPAYRHLVITEQNPNERAQKRQSPEEQVLSDDETATSKREGTFHFT